MVYKVLSEGHYRKQVDRLRNKLAAASEKSFRQLDRACIMVDISPVGGMRLWVETGVDTNLLAEKAIEQDYLLTPGSLFPPAQLPSSRMRPNVATQLETLLLRLLRQELVRS